jgi:hypothetical protein
LSGSVLPNQNPRHPAEVPPTTVETMTSREERLARNEATSREINEGIEDALEGAPAERFARMVCECGYKSCDRLIAITLPEYEGVRTDARQFAVVRDHVIEDLERVVAETDRFVVVAKHEGLPAAGAVEQDPRT